VGFRLRLALFVAATSIACGSSPIAPDPTIDELRSAPLAVSIDGTSLELRASVWRDFMPIVPPGGPFLQVAVRLPNAAASVSVDHLWVLLGDQLWDATPDRAGGSTEWTARGGPQWGPGVRVDVVVRLRAADGRVRLLRAADQPIVGVS
jgi:hypothetical protein